MANRKMKLAQIGVGHVDKDDLLSLFADMLCELGMANPETIDTKRNNKDYAGGWIIGAGLMLHAKCVPAIITDVKETQTIMGFILNATKNIPELRKFYGGQ